MQLAEELNRPERNTLVVSFVDLEQYNQQLSTTIQEEFYRYGILIFMKIRLDSLEATQRAPRDARRGSREERSPLLPLQARPDSSGDSGVQRKLNVRENDSVQ